MIGHSASRGRGCYKNRMHSTTASVGDLLRQQALLTPGATALGEGDSLVTFAQLDQETDGLALWLLAEGFVPGDRIAIHRPNSLATVRLYFGIFKAGMIAVPVNLRLKQEETAHVLRHSGAKACFSAPAVAAVAEGARTRAAPSYDLSERNCRAICLDRT